MTAEAGLEYAEPGRRVLGLFAPGNMTIEWRVRGSHPYPAHVTVPQPCQEHQRPPNEPSLAGMTAKSIALLNRPAAGPGFLLQVDLFLLLNRAVQSTSRKTSDAR